MRLATRFHIDENGVIHPVWEEREETPAEIAARKRAANLVARLYFKYRKNVTLASDEDKA